MNAAELTHLDIDRTIDECARREEEDACSRSGRDYPPAVAWTIRRAATAAVTAARAVVADSPYERLLRAISAVMRAEREWRRTRDDDDDPDAYGTATFGSIGGLLRGLGGVPSVSEGGILSIDVLDVFEQYLEGVVGNPSRFDDATDAPEPLDIDSIGIPHWPARADERAKDYLECVAQCRLAPAHDAIAFVQALRGAVAWCPLGRQGLSHAAIRFELETARLLREFERRLSAPNPARSMLKAELDYLLYPGNAGVPRHVLARPCRATADTCRYSYRYGEVESWTCIDCGRNYTFLGVTEP